LTSDQLIAVTSDNTLHSPQTDRADRQTDINDPGGIRTITSAGERLQAELRLRPLRLLELYIGALLYFQSPCYSHPQCHRNISPPTCQVLTLGPKTSCCLKTSDCLKCLSCYSHLSSCPCQAMKTNRAVQLQLCSLTLAPVGAISFTLQQFCPRAKCPRTH